eukprot:scaffold195135_cov15-Prasinocladus_malaysianus.AAC.1
MDGETRKPSNRLSKDEYLWQNGIIVVLSLCVGCTSRHDQVRRRVWDRPTDASTAYQAAYRRGRVDGRHAHVGLSLPKHANDMISRHHRAVARNSESFR